MKFAVICLVLAALLLSCGQSSEKTQKDLPSKEIATLDHEISQKILQLALDAEKLQDFFHFDMPGRETLCLLNKNIPSNLNLEKNGIPVKVVDSLVECENCIVVDSLAITDSTATIKISYPIEGLIGNFYFERSSGAWTLRESELLEI